jgi:hypothetical protein
VSVWGTGRGETSLEAFLGSTGSLTSPDTARHHASPTCTTDLTCGAGHTLTPAQPPAGLSYLSASPHHSPTTHQDPATPHPHLRRDTRGTRTVSTAGLGVERSPTGTGLSTRSPSTTPLGLALGPDSPRADQPAPGTLGHPAEGILTLHALLMPAFSLAPPPPLGPPTASPVARRSPTHPHTWTPPRKGDAGLIAWMPQLRRCA